MIYSVLLTLFWFWFSLAITYHFSFSLLLSTTMFCFLIFLFLKFSSFFLKLPRFPDFHISLLFKLLLISYLKFGETTIGISFIIVSFFGILLNRQSLLIFIIMIEISLLGIIIIWGEISIREDDIKGIVWIVIILVLAASESAIGLALLVKHYKNRNTLGVLNLSTLKN